MNIKVSRDLYTSLSVQGELFLDGVHECFTLEPAWKTDGSKPRAIPNGTFPLTIRWSWKFKRHVPHIENVPGFDAVEQHVGNFPDDTDACTLVGQTRGPQPNFIGRSLVAFTQLMNKYLAVATLTNPDSPEQQHVWNVGQITFYDARTPVPDLDSEIAT